MLAASFYVRARTHETGLVRIGFRRVHRAKIVHLIRQAGHFGPFGDTENNSSYARPIPTRSTNLNLPGINHFQIFARIEQTTRQAVIEDLSVYTRHYPSVRAHRYLQSTRLMPKNRCRERSILAGWIRQSADTGNWEKAGQSARARRMDAMSNELRLESRVAVVTGTGRGTLVDSQGPLCATAHFNIAIHIFADKLATVRCLTQHGIQQIVPLSSHRRRGKIGGYSAIHCTGAQFNIGIV
jgi:hypothetical protein